MLKKILLLISPHVFLSALSAQVTQEEADSIVLKHMAQESLPYTVFAKDGVQTDMIITTIMGETIELNYDCWAYYINYTDVGCYLIVNESNGNLLKVNANSAEPNDLPKWREHNLLEVETDFYYYGEKKIYFKIRKDIVIIKANSEAEAKTLSKDTIFIEAFVTNYDMVIAIINPLRIKLNNLRQMPNVVDATYGLEYADKTLQFPTYKIAVKFKKGLSSEKALNDIGLIENVEEIEEHQYAGYTLITLNVSVRLGNILQICRNLYESGLCEFAEPSFIKLMQHFNHSN